jgi:hypothetical protein
LKKGGVLITGPSINLAKIIAQQMGNMRIENKVVSYDATHVTCEATCFDLEKNFAIRTQIKRSISGKDGRYSEDMCTIIGNAGNAIALRNAIFAVVDSNIIDKIYSAAKQKITGDVSDEIKLIARRNTIIDGFKDTYKSYNLTDDEIAGSVGKASINHINANDLITLIGFEGSLSAGEITFDSVFRPIAQRFAKPIENKTEERLILLLDSCKTRKELDKFKKDCSSTSSMSHFDKKYKELK